MPAFTIVTVLTAKDKYKGVEGYETEATFDELYIQIAKNSTKLNKEIKEIKASLKGELIVESKLWENNPIFVCSALELKPNTVLEILPCHITAKIK